MAEFTFPYGDTVYFIDFQNFLALGLTVFFGVFLIMLLAREYTRIVLYKLVYVIAAGFAAWFVYYLVTKDNVDIVTYLFLILFPVILYTFAERLTPIWGPIVQISRAIALMGGTYFISYSINFEDLDLIVVYMVQYSLLGISLVSSMNLFFFGGIDEDELGHFISDWFEDRGDIINLTIGFLIITYGALGTIGNIYLEGLQAPDTYGHLCVLAVGVFAVFFVDNEFNGADTTFTQVALFVFSMGLQMFISSALEGWINYWGMLIMVSPFVYRWVVMLSPSILFTYMSWLVFCCSMAAFVLAGPAYGVELLCSKDIESFIYAIYCLVFSVSGGIILTSLLTIMTPVKLMETYDW